MARVKIGVLISGRGSNMQALIEACAARSFPAEIALVISNNADAAGLELARAAGIATRVVDHRGRPREEFEAELQAALTAAKVRFVCLAGFMRVLTPAFVARWHDRMVNIHPSLLPAFQGIHVHERVLASGVRFTGCTVHFVRPEVDHGPIIIQAAVPVLPDDTAETLAARVLGAEHRIYPLALRWIAEKRLHVDGNRVTVDGAEAHVGMSINPGAAA
jgi:phosphoribosylglycinamide formyltransferase-1